MTPALCMAHAEYACRAVVVTVAGCWMAAMIGYWISDEVQA